MDHILLNARIFTMDPACPEASACLVRDGRYAIVGDETAVRAAACPDAAVTDLQGAAVYPGMVDSHLHILNAAVTARELVLNGMRCRSEVLQAIAAWAKHLPAGSPVDGRGFNEDLWDDRRLLTRRELDEAAPEQAVRLTRVCGHMVIANTKALTEAGITACTPVPDGGEMDWENGILRENAINLLVSADADRGVEACKALLKEGMGMAADAGLTGLFSDDFGADGFSMATVTEAYRQLDAEGQMPVRVVQQCAMPTSEDLAQYRALGLRYGMGSDMYRLGPRKLYADGSLGARTAWLSRPYADAPDRTGVPIYSPEELCRLAEESHREGLPFIVHAIGDAAASCVLDAIAHARQAVPGSEKLPSGIVHCQITDERLLDRITAMNVMIYAQPVFTEYDLHICRDRVGEELEKTSYNWAELLHRGVCISSGSDCPVEPLDPARNIYCAVTRKDFDRLPEGGWMPEQRLTAAEAVYCHTVQAARAVGMEDRLGMIRPGYLADATVFPLPLDAIDPDDILTQKPLMTMVNGRLRACPQ